MKKVNPNSTFHEVKLGRFFHKLDCAKNSILSRKQQETWTNFAGFYKKISSTTFFVAWPSLWKKSFSCKLKMTFYLLESQSLTRKRKKQTIKKSIKNLRNTEKNQITINCEEKKGCFLTWRSSSPNSIDERNYRNVTDCTWTARSDN